MLVKAPPPSTPSLQTRAQRIIDEYRIREDLPGLIVAVRSGGKPVLELASGDAVMAPRADVLSPGAVRSPMRPDDAMWAGSITKTVTAATTLQLAEAGKLSLDDTIARWLPDFPDGASVTVRQLLTHTSGIPNITEQPDVIDRIVRAPAMTVPQLVAEIGQLPGRVEPGVHRYSNSNYNLLGAIIERAAGRPLTDVVQDRVIEPAGAAGSAFLDMGRTPSPVRAHEYWTFEDGSTVDQHGIYGSERWWRSVAGAAGGLATSAADLARIGEAILRPGGAALSDAMRGAMIASVEASPDKYGFGLFRDPIQLSDGPHTAYGHNGAVPGASAYLMHVPDTDQTIAVMVNSSKDDGHELTGPILDLLRGVAER